MVARWIAAVMLLLGVTPAIGQPVELNPLQPQQQQNDPPADAAPVQGPPTQDQAVLGDSKLARGIRGENVQLTVDDFLDPALWTDFISDAVKWLIGFVPRVISAIILLFIFWLIYRVVRKVVIGGMKAAGVDESIRDMLANLMRWAILGFGLVIAGNQIGLQIAALLTGVSIIGLAVGFAAQESLSNFIAGIMIFWDKPFKIGDWIEIDGHLGQVRRVTFRSTRLQDLDGDIVVFPNTAMLQHKLINKTTNPVTRANVPVSIAYKESIDRAREVLLAVVRNDPRIEKTPEPEVVVHELADSGVNLMLHFWIREERYEDAMQYEYMEKAKEALDEAGIEIPFPHRQLILSDSPALASLRGLGGDGR